MNCIEKMYKEIEEIIKKEELEQSRAKFLVKEIKLAFSNDDKNLNQEEVVENLPVYDYLESISFENLKIDKKYFDVIKAKNFIEFIFKKFLCFNKNDEKTQEFLNGIQSKINENDLIESLKNLENEFINIVGDSEEVKAYFTNPYNGLYKDEKGYYAVILNGKYSDVKRPIGFNLNQLKKLIKEEIDTYVEDFSYKFNIKEKATLLNTLKAEINKNDSTDSKVLEEGLEKSLMIALKKYDVSESEFENYINEKGLRLIKQNNFYFREKAYKTYANYKKIEFRY